ncbi:MAG TPA: hypothetical protein VI386_35250 [Candidatus Sulfotelmatobacter sp.]
MNPIKTSTRPQARTQSRVAPLLDKKLLAYAAAASAAGVGLLGQTAEGKVVYTPANISIPQNNVGVHLDLNRDGISDFVFYNSFFQGARQPEGAFESGLRVYGSVTGNGVWGVLSGAVQCAAVLPKGAKVGPAAPFDQQAALFENSGSYTRGAMSHCKWHDAHRGAFLGLKFVINGQTHYGWAHVTTGYQTATITGYAYETAPNQPIHTGTTSGPVEHASISAMPVASSAQRATLGLLAAGECGLAVWRKSEGGYPLA